MSKVTTSKIKNYLDFPRQTLSDKQKNDDWYKENIDFAENILSSDNKLRNSFKNKKVNYDLAVNEIDIKEFLKIINPDKLDLKTLPANFQHIGVENTKIDLLVGEYSKRRKEYRAYLSSNDKEGIGRKEASLQKEITDKVTELIKNGSSNQEEIKKELEKLNHYLTYDFQDVAEITANKILKKEYKEQNLDFLFMRTFEDLLRAGEQIVYCGVLGGEPVMRRVNPLNLYTLGGSSMFIEDADIIVEYGYQSIGKTIDDYWDVLTEEDIEFLESGKNTGGWGGYGKNRDMSVFERFGSNASDELQIFIPNELGVKTFAGAFDGEGRVRVLKVCWRSRRKIGERTYYDEDGQEQKDYVTETYKPDKSLGEKVKWLWVNEWLEGTKIGDSVYTKMKPVPYASKSIVNKSKGTPPYVGSVNATSDYKVQSLVDVMKPLTYSYDVAYYKRELEIATYSGAFTAINSSMIPSGWTAEAWIQHVKINKLAWLDPTNEILKGPSQGKSAGAFNTLTATQVQMGDANAIQMYTNLLLDIENTLGKIAGVSGAREGQIENREAVGNVEREVAQTSHITEKWFAIDSNFRKRAMTKFLECCKYAYKKNPKKGQFLLDDMAMVTIDNFSEFVSSEYDIHIANSSADTQLYEDLRALSQAAIQNGQATIADLVAITQSESIQDIARKLDDSARKIKEQNEQLQQQQMKAEQEFKQIEMQDKQVQREFETMKFQEEMAVKREEIESRERIAEMKEMSQHVRDADGREHADSDKNGIDDYLDTRRTDIDERYKNQQVLLAEKKLAETIRANKAKEQIAKSKPTVSSK